MKRHRWKPAYILLALVFFVAACGNTGEDEDNNTPVNGDEEQSDAGEEPADENNSPNGDEDGNTEGDEPSEEEDENGSEQESAPSCTTLSFDMHEPDSGQVFITLKDMQHHYEDMTDYDIVFARVHGQGPTGYLGNGVTALNAGNETAFSDFNIAVSDGYAADDTKPIIGSSWQNGGSGTEGYVVTGNVYVLKLADGTYAKIAVTSAKGGLATIDAFYQADGSTDLTCQFE